MMSPSHRIWKDFYLENTDSDLFVKYLEQVIDLQQFLEQKKVKYLMFNAFGNKELYKENFDDRRIYPILDKMNFDAAFSNSFISAALSS